MKDVVERLRNPHLCFEDEKPELFHDAIVEIERLRAALKPFAEYPVSAIRADDQWGYIVCLAVGGIQPQWRHFNGAREAFNPPAFTDGRDAG